MFFYCLFMFETIDTIRQRIYVLLGVVHNYVRVDYRNKDFVTSNPFKHAKLHDHRLSFLCTLGVNS